MNAGIIWKALAMIARTGATKIERIGGSTAKSCGTTVVIALRKFWDNARDFHDHIFDDRWWGAYGWGVGWAGHYPVNPWWWWAGSDWRCRGVC